MGKLEAKGLTPTWRDAEAQNIFLLSWDPRAGRQGLRAGRQEPTEVVWGLTDPLEDCLPQAS